MQDLFEQAGASKAQRQEALYRLYHGPVYDSSPDPKYPRPVFDGYPLNPEISPIEPNLMVTIEVDASKDEISLLRPISPTVEERRQRWEEFVRKYKARIVKKNRVVEKVPENNNEDVLVVDKDMKWESL